MSKLRKGSARAKNGRYYGEVRVGKDARVSFAMPHARSQDDANERAALAAEVASVLLAAGRGSEVDGYVREVGDAPDLSHARLTLRAVRAICAAGANIADRKETMASLAKRWTSGELHREYPDFVREKRSSFKDSQIFARHIEPHVGPIPVASFTLDHAELVMRKLPKLSSSSRRHVAQVLAKLLRMAAYPLRLIPATPLPKGFLPRITAERAKSWLYPAEDARLLACENVPLDHRILYGVLDREGLRVSEALALEWADLDLEMGTLRLDKNKTDDPRTWMLEPDVVRTFARWKKLVGDSAGPFVSIAPRHIADRLRQHLAVAGVTRPELFDRSTERLPIRIHDLRGTFVTISLANGKTETWVQDRTGHGSTLMINRYRKAARHAAELDLGPLGPLDTALAWGATGGRTGGKTLPSGGCAMNEKTSGNAAVAPPGLEPGRPCGPEILSPGHASERTRKQRKPRKSQLVSELRSVGSGEIPPVYAGLAEGVFVQRVTWEAFDLLSFEEEDEGM